MRRRWWIAILVYFSLPVMMLFNEGMVAFLEALLWPIPIFLVVALSASIPFWAGYFGNEVIMIAWIIQWLGCGFVTALLGRKKGNYRQKLCQAWGIMAVLNILGLFVFPIDFPN